MVDFVKWRQMTGHCKLLEQHVQRPRAVKGHSILGNGFGPAVSQLQRGCVGMGMGKVVGDGKRQVCGAMLYMVWCL